MALFLAVAGNGSAMAGPAPLTSDDIAVGGVSLEALMKLPADGKYRTVLAIKNLEFGPGEAARAQLSGVLSMKNNARGSTLVRLRMSVNDEPMEYVFSHTIPAQAHASVPIRCNAMLAAGQPYEIALEVAVIGAGPTTVDAGTLDLAAFRPIFNPPALPTEGW
jgi:hypothetical protein